MLSEQELKRYDRQMIMDGWGEETQSKLKASTAFIAGAGGLGSPVSIYLAVAGEGNIRICDFDSPDTPCLQCIFPEAPPHEVFPWSAPRPASSARSRPW